MTPARLLPLLAFLLSLAAIPTPAAAQSAPPAIEVGLREMPPFAMTDAAGNHTGLAVDLFRLAAERAGLAPRFVALAPGADPAAALASLDVVLPLEASPALERASDLTHPFYTATLGYAEARTTRVVAVVTGLLTWQFLRVVLGVSLVLLVVGALVWAIERRRNGEQFHRDPVRGLGDGFWWAGVTLTTIGYGDKAPATLGGRAVAMLWMLVGLAVSASLTATVVSLADAQAGGGADLGEAVKDARVVAARDGLAAGFVARRGIDVAGVDGTLDALRAVSAGAADVALGAGPVLDWGVAEEGLELRVTTTRWDPVLLTAAVATGDPLRERLDAAILEVISSEAGQATVRRYLPDG
jgi:ABC-type amino acid transport substrate-binding protein